MDSNQIVELFISRGLIDRSLGQDILAEVENSGKEAAEILADFQVINHRDDVWPVVASELGASSNCGTGPRRKNSWPWSPPEPPACTAPCRSTTTPTACTSRSSTR